MVTYKKRFKVLFVNLGDLLFDIIKDLLSKVNYARKNKEWFYIKLVAYVIIGILYIPMFITYMIVGETPTLQGLVCFQMLSQLVLILTELSQLKEKLNQFVNKYANRNSSSNAD